MPSSPTELIARHDPAAWSRAIRQRPLAALPFDAATVVARDAVMLDTVAYIDAMKAPGLPRPIAQIVAQNTILHSAIAAAELAVSIGHLDPRDARTANTRKPLDDALARMRSDKIVVPSSDAWIEAAVIAGICARTQGYAKLDRRKLLHDALVLLSAIEADAVLISRNIRDIDLLLNFRPDARVLLYARESRAGPT